MNFSSYDFSSYDFSSYESENIIIQKVNDEDVIRTHAGETPKY